ncbi:MAG: hypothetical protein NVSMB52_02480 [Chloroflexota bacterium]
MIEATAGIGHCESSGMGQRITIDACERRKEEFSHLLQRYMKLGRSFNSASQRERAALQYPLMRLYVDLYPGSGFKIHDDVDVAIRALQGQMKCLAQKPAAA